MDLIIRNGTIIDGTGAQRFQADVGVQDGRIAEIGNLPEAPAPQQIDATGKIVCPGFIDVHNHSDGWLLREGHQTCKTMQGFTTEIIMSDGISYAPVSQQNWRDWIYYLRGLNGLRMQDYTGWESLDQYLTELSKTSVQNFAAQIPYANLRTLVHDFSRGTLDDSQLVRMKQLVQECLEAGAVALSTGLDYVAQCFSPTSELVHACLPMAGLNKPYVTHIRYKSGLIEGIREAIEIGRQANVPVHISHLKCQDPYTPEQIFELIEEACAEGIPTTFDVYPYQPGSTMLNYLLPYEVWEDGPLAATGKLSLDTIRRKVKHSFESYRLDLEHVLMAWSPSTDHTDDWGKTLLQIVEESGKEPVEALTDLLLDEQLAVLCVMDEGDDKLVEPLVAHPRCMMGTDAIYQPNGNVHPRAYGSTGRWLGPFVRDSQLFTLEEAIRKMTSLSADTFGLEGRGRLEVNAHADLVVFDDAQIQDHAQFGDPQHHSPGIEQVVINGTPVIVDAQPHEFQTTEQVPGHRL